MSVLDRVKQLAPIQFRYDPGIDPSQILRGGFSAQQVRELFPDAVVESNGYLMIDLKVLRGYIEEAMKENKTQKRLKD